MDVFPVTATAHHFRVLATDLDGTLTDAGRPTDVVLDAVRAARVSGLRVVLVTGRILTELRSAFPDVDDHFDAIVAENGAVLVVDASPRDLAPPVDSALLDALRRREISTRQGDVLIACSGVDEHTVLEEIRRLGLECQLVRNRAELMILPSGINKGTGLLAALRALGLSPHNAIAVGDAENDHSLFDVAEVGVAVANAVPSLRDQADLILDQADGAGVASLLTSDLLADRAHLWPRRWHITIGVDEDHAAVQLSAAQLNILVAGGSGAGKSYVAGLVAEQLIALGYSLLVIDPEGDHIGLGQLEGVLVAGGDRHLPPPASVVPLLRHRNATVVVDLSHLDNEGQDRYLDGLPAEIEAQRRTTGLPHWVFVDEADRSMGRHGLALGAFDPAVKGHCLITWRPGDLSADALAGVDVVLALTSPQPDATLVDITAAVADVPRATIAERLSRPTGAIVLAERSKPHQARLVVPTDRVTFHFRHEHKYALGGATAPARFHFRAGPERLTGATAGNLVELETELASCEPTVLRHHCTHHDLSRWIKDVFHDDPLADAIRIIERRVDALTPAAAVEAARLDVLAALQTRRPC